MSHRDFCQRFFDALSTGRFDIMGEMMHPDFFVLEAEGLPYAGVYRGLEGWKALAKAVVTTWSGFTVRIVDFVGETEHTAIMHMAIAGKSRKTGKAFEMEVLELWRFKDGLICELKPFYFDTNQLAIANAP